MPADGVGGDGAWPVPCGALAADGNDSLDDVGADPAGGVGDALVAGWNVDARKYWVAEAFQSADEPALRQYTTLAAWVREQYDGIGRPPAAAAGDDADEEGEVAAMSGEEEEEDDA